jgi:N-acetylglucosaminyl-diphospho-decaprenol L-rhamnosyltransferase
MSINDITVVITSFKSDDKIFGCLNSIDNQCQVILVENSSDIKIKEKIEKQFKNVNCILSGENLGYGKANNIGLKKVKSKYALILNPDASLDKYTLSSFLKLAEKHPQFSIIAPYKQEYKQNNFDLEKTNLVKVKNVKGFAMFLNLKEFEEIGYFDENFFIYFEEIDLCKRLTNSNKEIYLSSSITINHDGAQSHNKSINTEMELSRNWHWMWSTFYYHKKHTGFIASFFIILPKLISAIFKIFLYFALNNKGKKKIYYQRYSGIINSLMGKKSWYRPKV